MITWAPYDWQIFYSLTFCRIWSSTVILHKAAKNSLKTYDYLGSFDAVVSTIPTNFLHFVDIVDRDESWTPKDELFEVPSFIPSFTIHSFIHSFIHRFIHSFMWLLELAEHLNWKFTKIKRRPRLRKKLLVLKKREMGVASKC